MQVNYELNDGIALISLDDGKKNAITPDAAADIHAAIDDAENSATAIVLAGRPGSFCAGFDLATMTSGDAEAINALSLAGANILLRLFGIGKPLVAACTGHAFTIGALWLVASDTRIGEEGNFKFGMNETAMGVPLPDWALEPLKNRINPTAFLPIVTQSRMMDPAGAVEAGFLDQLVPEGQAVTVALETAAQLAQLPASAYAMNKLQPRARALEIMRASLAS